MTVLKPKKDFTKILLNNGRLFQHQDSTSLSVASAIVSDIVNVNFSGLFEEDRSPISLTRKRHQMKNNDLYDIERVVKGSYLYNRIKFLKGFPMIIGQPQLRVGLSMADIKSLKKAIRFLRPQKKTEKGKIENVKQTIEVKISFASKTGELSLMLKRIIEEDEPIEGVGSFAQSYRALGRVPSKGFEFQYHINPFKELTAVETVLEISSKGTLSFIEMNSNRVVHILPIDFQR